ncbi:MAG: undecaprenyldiphospho-muramoylpentapeptide beta-N-acetylglucosaminyltransferase [Marinilabiliales bacterium]|nr:MAG: undecaprenyldiphospho-muramoylpentapeptide beta-N-acetylglucosaminyltransferase [Marinilabiliales bacterium]
MTGRRLKILLSGGGTGGHVFPAIAIADALKEIDGSADILFVGARHKMEMERVPAAGYSIVGLPVTGFQRRVTVKNILFFFNLLASMVRSHKILNRFRPDVVVGVGGYASGPVARAAASKGIPLLIQEQNSFAGVTNRMLGKHANSICVAWEGMERYFQADKIVLTGNPVRRGLQGSSARRIEAAARLGVCGKGKVLLVTGGSLGAGSINRSIIENFGLIRDNDIELIWQTGKTGYADAVNLVEKNGLGKFFVFEFIREMDLAYALADAVIARAGAVTLSELCVAGKPAVLVPSPNVAEDHQTKNAMTLAEKDAAIVIPDRDAVKQLVPEAVGLLNDNKRLKRLSINISALARPDAARNIAEEVLKLVKEQDAGYR